MPDLKSRIKVTLDEGRMLILGVQVLIGFEFRSVLEKGFELTPVHSQYVELCGLCLMLVAVVLLMWPGAYHRLVENGQETEDLIRFASTVIGLALFPFAIGIGADFFVATERFLGFRGGVATAALVSVTALIFWYGIEAVARSRRKSRSKEKSMPNDDDDGGASKTDLQAMIEHVLTEIRVVLPGAQALLGFQLAALLMEGFDKLPQSSKYVHFAGLIMMALAIILMMTPPAFHRLVERGETSERFHRFTGKMLLFSMIFLAPGICADLFVVSRKITSSLTASTVLALLILALFYGCWFGYSYFRRRQQQLASTKSRLQGV